MGQASAAKLMRRVNRLGKAKMLAEQPKAAKPYRHPNGKPKPPEQAKKLGKPATLKP